MVAATDFPEEYRLKRGGIAEKLYSYQFTGNPGFNSMKASVGNGDLNVQKQNGGGDEKEVGGNGDVPKAECGQKTKHGSTEHEHAVTQMTNRNDRKGKAMEDGNHEADEESQILGEVLRIKELISNSRNEVCTTQFPLLRIPSIAKLIIMTFEMLPSCGFLVFDCLIVVQSERVLFDALKRLQLMPISVKILQVGNESVVRLFDLISICM